eukprot:1343490-Rhodomonas_salina.2
MALRLKHARARARRKRVRAQDPANHDNRAHAKSGDPLREERIPKEERALAGRVLDRHIPVLGR